MSKAIKPLVVILFLLTATALYLGINLFAQREKIKVRLLALEKSAIQVADNIHYEGLDPNLLQDYTRTAKQLRPLEVAASLQYEDLIDTKEVLAATEAELEQTKTTLAMTEQELESKKTEIVQLNNDLESKEQQIVSLEGDVEDLEIAKNELSNKVEQLSDELTVRINELNDAHAEYASLKAAYDEEVRRGLGEGVAGIVVTPSDLTGQILSVNTEWNFVILDIGGDEGLKTNAEMLVHRSKDFVGKVRISDVRDQVSVAEIVNDWEQQPIRIGDTVISPQS